MKHLPVIFITLSIILSVIACILPNWAISSITPPGGKSSSIVSTLGLFTQCSTNIAGKNQTNCNNNGMSTMSGIIPVQIFSIVALLFLVIGTVSCSMNMKKSYVLVTLIGGIVSLLTTLIIFATTTMDDGTCTDMTSLGTVMKCPVLSTSWYLELGAVILAIVGVVIKARSSIKK